MIHLKRFFIVVILIIMMLTLTSCYRGTKRDAFGKVTEKVTAYISYPSGDVIKIDVMHYYVCANGNLVKIHSFDGKSYEVSTENVLIIRER